MNRSFMLFPGVAAALLLSGPSHAQSSEPPSSSPPSTVAGQAPRTVDYVSQQRELQQRVDALRAELFASRVHLGLLAEPLLGEAVGGGRVSIRHENAMGSLFRLERATFTLDGAALHAPAAAANGTLYNGALSPGDHTLTIDLEYAGRGLGVFGYLEGYHFHLHSLQSFTLRPGRGIDLRVVGFEQGVATRALDQRPAVRVIARDVPMRDLRDPDM